MGAAATLETEMARLPLSFAAAVIAAPCIPDAAGTAATADVAGIAVIAAVVVVVSLCC